MPSLLFETFTEATEEAKNALRFYEENYVSVAQYIMGKKETVPSSHPGVCRFCSLSYPEISFRKEAHAVPECLGNTSLFTSYECDECNQFFGDGIEANLGNWSKTQRVLSGIRGKRGVPTVKEETLRQWRLERDAHGIKVTQNEADPIAVVNEDKNEITLTVRRDTYTPVAVLKAFSKIGICLIPEMELPNFQKAIAWIRNPDHRVGLVKPSLFPLLYTFVPGSNPLASSIILLRRRHECLLVPYLTVVTAYGNEMFQTILPSPERDARRSGLRVKFPYFPTPYELDSKLNPDVAIRRERIDLTGRDPVRGEIIQTVLRYDST